jgi:hypothetical protein
MLAPPDSTATFLRRGLLWLAGLTTLGLVVELGAERHWTQPAQLIAWGAVAAAAIAAGLAAGARSSGAIRLARALAIAVMLSAVVGIWQHVYGNYDAGPLDREYTDTWDSLSEGTRWWLALSKSVGPSPPLAPAALAQVGLSVMLATTARGVSLKKPLK